MKEREDRDERGVCLTTQYTLVYYCALHANQASQSHGQWRPSPQS